MQIELYDQVVLDEASVRITRDGYMVAKARSARTGIQEYRARELGLTDRDPDAVVRVYRPADEVFASDAMASMAHRPVTMDHPSESVTAENWKRYARGATGEQVVRDGEFVSVPLVLMDKAAIEDVKTGKRQLSWGYSCELELTDGVTASGEAYDAVQKSIRANHLAVCSNARGGPQLRIGDERRETSEPKDGVATMPHTLIIDGLQVPNVSDEAKAAIEKLQGQVGALTAAKDAAETKVGELTATIQTKDGEIAALNQKVKDAEVTPEKLQQLAAARAKVVADAKKIAGEALVVDGKTDAEIKRAAVEAKLGDAAKDMADAAIDGAFVTLAASGAAAPGTSAADSVRQVIASGVASVSDAVKTRDEAKNARLARFNGAHREEAAA